LSWMLKRQVKEHDRVLDTEVQTCRKALQKPALKFSNGSLSWMLKRQVKEHDRVLDTEVQTCRKALQKPAL
ncbi:hypothetical protein V5H42_25860, partial [Salmonella enterica]